MSSIRVYYAFRSPYSRLGLHIIDRAGLEVELIPFSGPPGDQGFDDPMANKLKLAYYNEDVPRMSAHMGLRVSLPRPFDVDWTPSYKAAVAADQNGLGLPFALAVSDARWGEGKDVSDMAVLEECARQVDWDPEEVNKAQSAMSVGKTLMKQRALIEEDGVFGVPFAVMNGAKYWGHDRFDLLVEEAKGAGN